MEKEIPLPEIPQLPRQNRCQSSASSSSSSSSNSSSSSSSSSEDETEFENRSTQISSLQGKGTAIAKNLYKLLFRIISYFYHFFSQLLLANHLYLIPKKNVIILTEIAITYLIQKAIVLVKTNRHRIQLQYSTKERQFLIVLKKKGGSGPGERINGDETF